jgi:hypothetical protein
VIDDDFLRVGSSNLNNRSEGLDTEWQDNRGFIMWAGERFDLNVPRDLPEGKAFAKIPQNGHFAVVGDDDAPNAEPSPADEKAELVAFAEKHGVKIDKRWSVAKITAAIEDAAAAANEE